MPTKTARILSYLPQTFRPAPQQSPLYALVDTFGNELLLGENSLAAIMQAHWVDHADRGAELIHDLKLLAALYGLAPRPDENVEEFREHLKRYIRTFLEGTVTVQGILRVTAEVLGLHIADAYGDLDTWWTRDRDTLVTFSPRRDDGTELVLGVQSATARGSPATPAQIVGTVDLSVGVDLRDNYSLQLQVNSETIAVNFASNTELDLQNLTLDQVVSEINQASNLAGVGNIASRDRHFLKLTSPHVGTTSLLEVLLGDNDAAERLLGLAPWIYRGQEATPAQLTGTVDLSGNIDMSDRNPRYLRLALDSTLVAEIDCADPTIPQQTSLNQIRDAINTTLGSDIASHDGHFLTLTSPTTGSSSRIEFQIPAAQDATEQLFGFVVPVYGQNAQPARMTSRRDLSGGVNLSDRSQLQIRLDGNPAVTIDCRGIDPTNTRPGEIVVAINNALGVTVARQLGRFLELTSPTVGTAAQIVIETPSTSDATAEILGLKPRRFVGAAATAASILGKKDLSQPVNLMASRLLYLSVDGSVPVEVDLSANVPDPQQATIGDLVNGINRVLGEGIASDDGEHLMLRSPTLGLASQLEIAPKMVKQEQRFITRASISDEATQAIFGFITREAKGKPATAAKVVGKLDLSRGVDLRAKPYLRLAIDGSEAVDVNCAGKRPRTTTISEVVSAINQAINQAFGGNNLQVASIQHKHYLMLTSPSPTRGKASKIVLEAPQAEDALSRLDLEPGTFWGQEATQVRFVGTADLSGNVDLSTASHIKIGIDNLDPVEIDCAAENSAETRIDEIVTKINAALESGIASQDGQHLILTSKQTGAISQLCLEIPDSPDATEILLGITPPRTYVGTNGTPATVRGRLTNPDLSVARFLKLGIDGQSAVEVDCAVRASDPTTVTLREIVDAINQVLGDGVARQEENDLILQSRQIGQAGQITLETFISGDAREVLLGTVDDVTLGEEAKPAAIAGEVDLLRPVDLSQRSLIRLAVDDNYPVEINVAGTAPKTTFLDEIIAAINAVFPRMAGATENDRLRLTSPTVGENSRLALLPVRYLDLTEYPPQAKADPPRSLSHGDRWSVNNSGIAEVFAQVEISAPQGVVGPTLVNRTLGWHVRLLKTLKVGEKARLKWNPERGLQAKIVSVDGSTNPIPGRDILVGLIGSQTSVPFTNLRHLDLDTEGKTTLQLNNPLTNYLIRLHSQSNITGNRITVAVTEADLNTLNNNGLGENSSVRLAGRLQGDGTSYGLLDGANNPVAQLRVGSEIDLAAYEDAIVAVEGSLYTDNSPPLMVVEKIARLFDVALNYQPESGEPVPETYSGVTIGSVPGDSNSLVYQLNSGLRASTLVRAESLAKETVLTLSPGLTQWLYQDCYSSRFNYAHFNEDKFAGGLCTDRGVFNVSRFTSKPPAEPIAAVFAPSTLVGDLRLNSIPLIWLLLKKYNCIAGILFLRKFLVPRNVEIGFQWVSHEPGAFQVNLPLDLPARFGARFNQSYFSQGKGRAELYEDIVTEPEDDPDYLLTKIANASNLVVAEKVQRVPLGWQPVQMPFRKPQFLTLGSDTSPAQIYLTEKDLDGFIQLKAKKNGAWGNQIAVAARASGIALYDISITYEGARFENARQVVLGEPLPALIQELLQPNPVGILQAKAAGIQATVSRDFNYIHGDRRSLTTNTQ